MSDLDNAINSINASAAKAENTATFLDDMSTFDDQSSVTNPNNGQTVASIPKQVKDRTDELFAAAESDINQAVADAEQSATDAQDAADSIGRYQGLWPESGGIADKGDTYQTQTGGTPTGQYFTALQSTTVDPVGDDVNWREVVSIATLPDYTNIVYTASGGNSAIENMIAGVPIVANVGNICSTGGTVWKVKSISVPMTLSDFELITVENGKDHGIKGGSQPTADAFEAACRYAIENQKSIYLPVDEYYLERDIDLSDTSGNLIIYGDEVSGGRTASQIPKAKIIFNNNGEDESGRIGINMGPDTGTIILNNIFLSTLITDARPTSGNFIGVVADGRGSEVSNCRVAGFNTAFELFDLGYSNWYRNYYQGNQTMLKHSLSSWPFGTTFRDRCSQSVQNTTVYDTPSLYHSHWADGVYEYSDVVIKSIQNGCTVSDCYFENNGTASVYSPDSAADLLALNNYYHGATDRPITSNNTTIHGFDRCGLLELDQNAAIMRALRFVDRSGVAAGYFQASRDSSGQIQVVDKDYNIEGNAPAVEGSGQNTDRLIKSIVIHNGTVYGLPSGWTFTAVGTGVYQFVFDGAIKLPNIQVTSTTTSVNSANEATHKLTMSESAGGNWSNFRTASGFFVRGYVNAAASDEIVININIII